jgi:DNA-binding transcriptional LysR family regulator
MLVGNDWMDVTSKGLQRLRTVPLPVTCHCAQAGNLNGDRPGNNSGRDFQDRIPGGWKELGKETFVSRNARTPARTHIIELFQKHRTPLNIASEPATLETIKDFVRLGPGLAILPRLSVRDALEAGTLVEVPVKGLAIVKELRMVYRNEENLSHAAKAFLALVREREIPKASRARRR